VTSSTSILLSLAVVVAGCAEPAHAPPPPPAIDAKVTDIYGITFVLHEVAIWEPESSSTGGPKGKLVDAFQVQKGVNEREIEQPLNDIVSMEIKGPDFDRLRVGITKIENVVVPELRNKELAGTVKGDLELRGRADGRPLEAHVLMREVKTIEFPNVDLGTAQDR
jgi:hypothetical protein